MDCLGEIVVASIQNFLLISTFVSKQQEYQELLKEKDPDTTKKKEALARKKEICRAEMVAIYTKLFRLLGKKTRSYTSYEQMYSFYFDIHDKVEEVVEQVYEKRESWETFEE